MQHARISIAFFILMIVGCQRWDVTFASVALYRRTGRYCADHRGLHGSLPDILRDAHFQVFRSAVIPGQSDKNLRLFRTSAAFFAHSRSAEKRIVEFDGPAEQVSAVPLPHGRANPFEHQPCGFVVHADRIGELHGGNAALILCYEIHRQEPLRQRNMAAMQESAGSDRSLMMTFCALIQSVAQAAVLRRTALGAYEVLRSTGFSKVVPTRIF